MKKGLRTLSIGVLLTTLTGCSFVQRSLPENESQISIVPENDDDKSFTARNVPFTNLTSEYEIESDALTLYFLDSGSVPYVSVMGFIRGLDGFFDCGENLRYQFYPQSNFLGLYRYYNGNQQSYVQFQWDNNRVWVSDMSFFRSITKSTADTNFKSYHKTVDYYSSGKKSVAFRPGSYYFDICYFEKKCLVPLTIMNLLFCSPNQYNIFYNGETLYGYYGEIDRYVSDYSKIFTSSLNGQNCPNDVRKASVNGLLFTLDYFYGLKNYKGIDSFKNYIGEESLNKLWSNDPTINREAYTNILCTKLDDLHTRIDSSSMYLDQSVDTSLTWDQLGDFKKNFYTVDGQLEAQRKSAFPNGVQPVRYSGDTAIITLDSFTTAASSDIYDSYGNLKSDAWRKDTYYFMRHCMADIGRHSGIKDVLIDLSQNGGGNIGAMERCLGFLTDNTLTCSLLDYLDGEYTTYYYKIDTDGDGYYDNDAYDQYRWTILSSINTFSAANRFTSDAKHQSIARVIGQRSGGGMCPIMSTVLADGTAITISSSSTIRYVTQENGKNVYHAIENGVKPNLEIPYSDFYDNSKLVSYIDQVWRE